MNKTNLVFSRSKAVSWATIASLFWGTLSVSASTWAQLQSNSTNSSADRQQVQINPLAPAPVIAEDLIAKYLGAKKVMWIGQRLIVTEDMLSLYRLRGNALIWITDGRLNAMSESLLAALQGLDRHGLNPLEYRHQMLVDSITDFNTNPSEVSMIRTEILFTDALLRAAKHIAYGRIIPEMIDSDIKFSEKKLTSQDLINLAAVVSADSQTLAASIDAMAPQHQFYKLLMTALADLKVQDQKAKTLNQKSLSLASPGITLSPGVSHNVVSSLRQALRERGFIVSLDGNLYDGKGAPQQKVVGPIEEDGSLQSAIMKFQSENGLDINPTIAANSDFWKTIAVPISKRIRQTELNLEKLRWLPKTLESEYIFVNLAFTEFNLYKVDPATGVEKPELSMKTVNGRLRWHSPFMRHQLTYLTLNPTWTAPDTIFAEYELPEIKKDIKFIEIKNMVFLQKPQESEKVDPATIDWTASPSSIVKQYRLRQEPGPGNALGLFRFGLNNDVDVYMHDTDSRGLFQQGNRFQSSGCIRLEKPNELAQYLMQGSDEYSLREGDAWETSKLCQDTHYPTFFQRACKDPNPPVAPVLDPITGKAIPIAYETKNIRFPSNRKLPPVYTVYVTVGRVGDRADGRIRYSQDPYGQDARVDQLVNQNITQEGF